MGKSIWSSSASRSRNSSYTSSTTSLIRASGRSTLLTTRITGSRASSALRSTNRVWGSGPSLASTSSSTPSTIVSPRSTSPPKSAWPGVSTMLSFTPPWRTAVFLARIVIPFSRSRSIESMTRSLTSWFSRNAPDCHSIASTRVVFPWSTWAMIATLRRSSRRCMAPTRIGLRGHAAVGAAVAVHAPAAGQRADRLLARRHRGLGEIAGVRVVVEQHHQRQQVRDALLVHLAGLGDGQQVDEEVVHAHGRRVRRGHVDVADGDVGVRAPGRQLDRLAGVHVVQPAVQHHSQRAGVDGDVLGGLGVDVLRARRHAGREAELELGQRAVRIRAGPDEGDLLTVDGVSDGLSGNRHGRDRPSGREPHGCGYPAFSGWAPALLRAGPCGGTPTSLVGFR